MRRGSEEDLFAEEEEDSASSDFDDDCGSRGGWSECNVSQDGLRFAASVPSTPQHGAQSSSPSQHPNAGFGHTGAGLGGQGVGASESGTAGPSTDDGAGQDQDEIISRIALNPHKVLSQTLKVINEARSIAFHPRATVSRSSNDVAMCNPRSLTLTYTCFCVCVGVNQSWGSKVTFDARSLPLHSSQP